MSIISAAPQKRKELFSHSLRDCVLEEIVLEALKQHIRQVIDLCDLLDMTDVAWLKKAGIQKLNTRLAKKAGGD